VINQSGDEVAETHFVSAHQPAGISVGGSVAPVGIFDDPRRLQSGIEPGDLDAAANDRALRPQWIARYQVINELAAARFGRIFRVRRPGFARPCVLMLSHRPLEKEPAALDRLERYSRKLTGCIHPNLVRVIDLDCYDGRPFIVMEHVYGLTLKQFAEERRPEPREAAGAVADLAGAVSYLLNCGIDPPEVDPADIVVDETGRPRLTAFGLSYLDFHNAGELEHSPADQQEEHVAVAQKTSESPSCVRGLGEVLYYLLTRRLPLPATTSFDFQRAASRRLISPRRLNSRVPRVLERICLRALTPAEEKRLQGARELERALRQFLVRRWIGLAGFVAISLPLLVFVLRRLRAGG
jgi:eukaryotic-like serine/threonine-protein kinase